MAGLGYVREDDAQYFEELEVEPPPVGTNAAIILGPSIAFPLTKAHKAEGESMQVGQGVAVVDIDVEKRHLSLGAAICLDYIHAGHTFGSRSQDLDIAVIPALSRDCGEFHPSKSRDFVRVVANHATPGGTSIYLPQLEGAAYVGSEGVEPLPAGAEGIVAVDFDRFAERRTGTQSTNNRLVYRSAIVYRDSIGSEPDAAARLAQFTADATTAGDRDELLGGWIEQLESESPGSLMVGSLKKLRTLARRRLLTPHALELLQTHLTLNEVQTDAEVRYAQVRSVLKRLRSELRQETNLPNLGHALQGYSDLQDALASQVRPALLASPRKTRSSKSETETVFALTLGTFETEDALRTLPRQLSLLRAFADLHSEDVALIYRLSTDRAPEGDTRSAHFEVICAVKDARSEFVEDLKQDLHDQMRVTFVDGWSVSTSRASPTLDHDWMVELSPERIDGALQLPEIREDWSPLVDQLRRSSSPMAIQLTLNFAEAPVDALWSPEAVDEEDSDEPGLIADSDRQAAAFFRRAAKQSTLHARSLGLRIHLAAGAEHGSWLPRAIGREILGNLSFSVRRLEAPPNLFPGPIADSSAEQPLILRPDEALRIFHPPFGHIQSRGLSGRRPTSRSLEGIELPTAGLTLGTATRQTSREDKRVRVKLDSEARLRHLYVVGKTGSGKTNLLKHLVRQDVKAGRGVAVLDPHGDLVDYALGHAENRLDDIVLLDFGRADALPVLNPLQLDVSDPLALDLAIEELVEIVVKRVNADYTGPVFEDIVRLALESITHERMTSIVPPSFLYTGTILNSGPARRWMARTFADTELGPRWQTFNRMKAETLAEHVRWVMAKFAEISKEGVLRSVLGGANPTTSIQDAVSDGKVLLVRLPEATIGPNAASFIGSLIFARIRRTMFDPERRENAVDGIPDPFYLYVDEFQKFVGGGFDQLIAEARKFGLGLTIAHQNLGQLEVFSRFERRATSVMLETLLGNVGNIVTMRTARRDGVQFAAELDVDPSEVASIGQFDALARVVVDKAETPAFTLKNNDADANLGFPATREAVRTKMIDDGVWRDRAELESLNENALQKLEKRWGDSDNSFDL